MHEVSSLYYRKRDLFSFSVIFFFFSLRTKLKNFKLDGGWCFLNGNEKGKKSAVLQAEKFPLKLIWCSVKIRDVCGQV